MAKDKIIMSTTPTTTTQTSSIVSKVWAFCNTLRDDGVGYGDYLDLVEDQL